MQSFLRTSLTSLRAPSACSSKILLHKNGIAFLRRPSLIVCVYDHDRIPTLLSIRASDQSRQIILRVPQDQ